MVTHQLPLKPVCFSLVFLMLYCSSRGTVLHLRNTSTTLPVLSTTTALAQAQLFGLTWIVLGPFLLSITRGYVLLRTYSSLCLELTSLLWFLTVWNIFTICLLAVYPSEARLN